MPTEPELLAEAKDARHCLLTGAAAVSFTDSNGKGVEYQAAHAGRLEAYVVSLEAQIVGAPRPHTIRLATSKGLF